MSSPVTTIAQIAINVKDLPRAVAFYRDTLGVPLLFEAPPALAFFKCGDLTLMLSPPEAPEFDHPASILYFSTPDIAESSATLRARGVAFRDDPHIVHKAGAQDLWMTFFTDSESNVLALMQWRPAAA